MATVSHGLMRERLSCSPNSESVAAVATESEVVAVASAVPRLTSQMVIPQRESGYYFGMLTD